MIEVIKHGQKKFKATCTHCGCEFTYELSDMHPLGGVDCPDCGHYVVHQNFGDNNGSLHYLPNSAVVYKPNTTGYPPKTMLFNTTTDADEANVRATLYSTQDVDLRAMRAFEESRHTEV